MTDGVSLADIAAVTDNKDGMFGGQVVTAQNLAFVVEKE